MSRTLKIMVTFPLESFCCDYSSANGIGVTKDVSNGVF